MGGLTKTFVTSQGDVTLARPGTDSMAAVAAKVIPLIKGATPVEVLASPEVRTLFRSSVTEETKDALEAVISQSDYVEFFELWEGYCKHGRFEKYFILPLEQARTKRLTEQAEEMAIQFAALIKHNVIKEDMILEMMTNDTSLPSPNFTSSGERGMAGAAKTSDEKTSG